MSSRTTQFLSTDVIGEVFKYLELKDRLSLALVSEDCNRASLLEKTFWRQECAKQVHIFEARYKVLAQQLTVGNAKKWPPDLTTAMSLDSRHDLSQLNKKIYYTIGKLTRRNYWRNIKSTHIRNNTRQYRRYLVGFTLCMTIVLGVFFILFGMADLALTSIPNWYSYAFIPVWLFFVILLGWIFFYSMSANILKQKNVVSMIAQIITFLVMHLSVVYSAVLCFLNLGVLPIRYNEITQSYVYTIPWAAILAPYYIGYLIVVVMIILTIYDNRKTWFKNGAAIGVFSLPQFSISSIVMFNFTLEYNQYFPAYYSMIPALLLISLLMGALFAIKNKPLRIIGWTVLSSYFVNVFVVGLYNLLGSYVWFSSLIPLLIAQTAIIILSNKEFDIDEVF